MDYNEQFEKVANEFYKEFRLLAPGKDQSPAVGMIDEAQTRRKLFDCWTTLRKLRTELTALKAEKVEADRLLGESEKRFRGLEHDRLYNEISVYLVKQKGAKLKIAGHDKPITVKEMKNINNKVNASKEQFKKDKQKPDMTIPYKDNRGADDETK